MSDAGRNIKPAAGWLGWKLIAVLGQRRKTLAGLTLLILAAAGLDLTVPFLTQGLIDRIVRIIQAAQRPETAALIQTLLLSTGGIFAATLVNRILRSIYNYRLVYAASQVEDELKNAAFGNYLRLDTAYHGKVNTGEVVGALDRGGTAIFTVLNEVLGQNLVPPLLIVAGVLVSLLVKNHWIALLVFMPLPAYLFAVNLLSPRMQKLEQEVSRAFEAVTRECYDTSSNVRVVKKFGCEKEEAQTQRRLLNVARSRHYAAERLWAVIENAQTFIAAAGRVSVIGLGGYFAVTHRCTLGEYVLFIAMQDMVYGPISQLSIILPKLRRNLSRAEKLFEILEQGRDLCDVPQAHALKGVRESIEFRNVAFRYPGCKDWALENVNLCVPAGATVALIGPSGSGKSTLMNLLQRLYDPQVGGIFVDGKDIRQITQASLREKIAVVPQEVELFSRSIGENISYGRERMQRIDLEGAAKLAQAHDFIQRTSGGYETQVGERGARLSGGERQRIGLARAILRHPAILILDEATSHLDNESERLIQLALEKVVKDRTCFIIAHRLSTVRNADVVAVFADGGIEAVGTHDDLWKTSPTYRKLHGLYLAQKQADSSAGYRHDETYGVQAAVNE